jgi:hypothetical protein
MNNERGGSAQSYPREKRNGELFGANLIARF